jgi:hypothetical protein
MLAGIHEWFMLAGMVHVGRHSLMVHVGRHGSCWFMLCRFARGKTGWVVDDFLAGQLFQGVIRLMA